MKRLLCNFQYEKNAHRSSPKADLTLDCMSTRHNLSLLSSIPFFLYTLIRFLKDEKLNPYDYLLIKKGVLK